MIPQQLGRAVSREHICEAARGWIGTPYHHQASLKDVGADCLGLVRGVWRDIYGSEAECPPPYSRDWAEATGIESMLDAAGRHMRFNADGDFQPGDVLIFRMRAGTVAKHAGLAVSVDTMVHAMEGGPATEVVLSRWWRRRIAGVFQFPGV